MSPIPEHLTAERWMTGVFSARSAATGGVVRRKVRDVERIVGREAFFEEMGRRGWTVVENAGQFVVFCNREPVRRRV